MKREDLLSLDIDNIAKARKSAVIGEERVWSGVTYVKTATGWKPKGNPRQKKEEDPTTKRDPKIEDPSQQKGKKEDDPAKRAKKLEEYASKAKDSQLEAAIEDPNQNPEVKDVAQTELDKREKETQKEDLEALKDQLKELKEILTKDLDQAKEKKETPGEIKVIKKTGLMLGGHKIFIVMNADNTGYKTQGMKALKLESKEGESLSDFKERIKQTWAAQQNETETKQEEKPSNKQEIDPQASGQPQFQEPSKDTGIKEIKKTGIMVDGHKMFITMNADKTGYVSKGFGLNLESKEGESLVDFKNRVKQALTDKLSGKEQKKENDEVTEAVKDTVVDEVKEEIKEEPVKQEDTEQKEFIQKLKNRIKGMAVLEPLLKKLEDSPYLKSFENDIQFNNFIKAYVGTALDKKKYFAEFRNKSIDYSGSTQEEIIEEIEGTIEKIDNEISEKDPSKKYIFALHCRKMSDLVVHSLETDSDFSNGLASTIGEAVSGEMWSHMNSNLPDKYSILANQLGVQIGLIYSGRPPFCFPMLYKEYKGEEYQCYDRSLYEDGEYEMDEDQDDDGDWMFFPAGEVTEKYQESVEKSKPNSKEERALSLYAGNSFYRFLTEYMIRDGKFDEMHEDAKNRGIKFAGSLEKAGGIAKKTIEDLNGYIDKNKIQENVILSRRVKTSLNEEIFKDMALLKEGDIGEFKSIQSFSYTQKAGFGDFQITLLAKKNDPIACAHNIGELEFISKQNAKYRVLETGYNSIAIELITE